MRFGAKSWRDDFETAAVLKQQDCDRKSHSYLQKKFNNISVSRPTVHYDEDIELLSLNSANQVVLEATGGCKHLSNRKDILIYELNDNQKRFYFDNSAFIKYTPIHITCLSKLMHVSVELELANGSKSNYHYGQMEQGYAPLFWPNITFTTIVGNLLQSGMVRLFNDARKYNKNGICGDAKNYTNFYNNVNSSITRADEASSYNPLTLNPDRTATYSGINSDYSSLARDYGGLVINATNLDINPDAPLDTRVPRQRNYVLGPPQPRIVPQPVAQTPQPVPQVVPAQSKKQSKKQKQKQEQNLKKQEEDDFLNEAVAANALAKAELTKAELAKEYKGPEERIELAEIDESIKGSFYYYTSTMRLFEYVLLELEAKGQKDTVIYNFVKYIKDEIQQNKKNFIDETDIIYNILQKFTYFLFNYKLKHAEEHIAIRLYNKDRTRFLECMKSYNSMSNEQRVTIGLYKDAVDKNIELIKNTEKNYTFGQQISEKEINHILNVLLGKIITLKNIEEINFGYIDDSLTPSFISVVPLYAVQVRRSLYNIDVDEEFKTELLKKYYKKPQEYEIRFHNLGITDLTQVSNDRERYFSELAYKLLNSVFGVEGGEWEMIYAIIIECLKFKLKHKHDTLTLVLTSGEDTSLIDLEENDTISSRFVFTTELLKVAGKKLKDFITSIKIISSTFIDDSGKPKIKIIDQLVIYDNKFKISEVLDGLKQYMEKKESNKFSNKFGKDKKKFTLNRDIAYLLKL
jgi:hypothetical protein